MASTVQLVKRALDVWRDLGPRTLWFRILGRTVYRRTVLIQRPLPESTPQGATHPSVTFGLLSATDVDAYLRFRPETEASTVHGRFEAGHLCVVARHEGRIVNAVWIATGRAWVDYLSCELPLAGDEAYLYESFTSPDFRGQSIPSVGVTHVMRYLRDAGYRRLVGVVLPENTPALRHAEKAGWRPFGVMGYVKLGPWRRNFHRASHGEAPPARRAP